MSLTIRFITRLLRLPRAETYDIDITFRARLPVVLLKIILFCAII